MSPSTNVTVTRQYTIPAEFPFDRIQMDLIGPLPETEHEKYKYVLIVVDCFSKFVTGFPLRNTEAKGVAEALLLHGQFFGFPCVIQSDKGAEFANKVIAELTELAGSEQILNTAYSKQENGQAENTNGDVLKWMKQMLLSNAWNPRKWSLALPFALRVHNTTFAPAINCTPGEIIFGWRANHNQGILLDPMEVERPKDKALLTTCHG
jgi:transposase InsO family protein